MYLYNFLLKLVRGFIINLLIKEKNINEYDNLKIKKQLIIVINLFKYHELSYFLKE